MDGLKDDPLWPYLAEIIACPEAFAIDDSPLSLEIEHNEQQYSVAVPHPYAWLNMKVRAAYDWVRERQGLIDPKLTDEGDAIRLKHVYDVYVLTAMLTQQELTRIIHERLHA